MKRFLKFTVVAVLFLTLSCQNEESSSINSQLITTDLASDTYQNSNAGIYNGVFTTIDGQERGSIQVTIPADENSLPKAQLSFSSGQEILIEASQRILFNSPINNLLFASNQTSFYFSVEGDGQIPIITNVTLNSLEGDVLIRKHTTRAPVTPIPGTYICTACGTHPVLNNSTTQTFNLLLFTSPDGDSMFDSEVTLGMNVFDGTGTQANCVAIGKESTCDLTGSFIVNGAPITWSGTHTFNNEASGSQDCSGAAGNWTFVSNSFGTLTGTFESDENCVEEFTLYSEGFDGFMGAGFAPMPAAGQLDSDIIIVNGFSDGDINYGDTEDMGDFARGVNDGGTSTGGVYSFDVDNQGERTLGFHPGETDFTPGYFEFRIENTSGVDLNNFTIAYDVWVNNDQGRANSLNFSYSTDGTTFTALNSLDFVSPEAGDANGFTLTEQTGTFAASIANEAFIFFRFEGDGVSGSGSRDEFAIDNILLTGN